MNKRISERVAVERPVSLHFFGEQVDVCVSEDISNDGFFVCTDSVRHLDKGIVALVTIELEGDPSKQLLAEVIRVTDRGAAFQVIEEF